MLLWGTAAGNTHPKRLAPVPPASADVTLLESSASAGAALLGSDFCLIRCPLPVGRSSASACCFRRRRQRVMHSSTRRSSAQPCKAFHRHCIVSQPSRSSGGRTGRTPQPATAGRAGRRHDGPQPGEHQVRATAEREPWRRTMRSSSLSRHRLAPPPPAVLTYLP